ncbi:MAG: hypothetical protein ACTSRU_05445 [Candidatus Hodarchaeales archaeon]
MGDKKFETMKMKCDDCKEDRFMVVLHGDSDNQGLESITLHCVKCNAQRSINLRIKWSD